MACQRGFLHAQKSSLGRIIVRYDTTPKNLGRTGRGRESHPDPPTGAALRHGKSHSPARKVGEEHGRKGFRLDRVHTWTEGVANDAKHIVITSRGEVQDDIKEISIGPEVHCGKIRSNSLQLGLSLQDRHAGESHEPTTTGR
jgi:hypothetical protein